MKRLIVVCGFHSLFGDLKVGGYLATAWGDPDRDAGAKDRQFRSFGSRLDLRVCLQRDFRLLLRGTCLPLIIFAFVRSFMSKCSFLPVKWVDHFFKSVHFCPLNGLTIFSQVFIFARQMG